MSTPAAQRILICLHDFSRGGTERIAIGLAGLWAAAGREVTMVCGTVEGGLRERVDPRVRVIGLVPPVRRGFLSRMRLARAMGKTLSALRPDVIFLPGNFHLFLAAAMRKADPHPAIALKISNPPLPGGLGTSLGEPVFRYFTRAIDGFAAVTPGLARDTTAILRSKRVAVLPDPVFADRSPVGVRQPGRGDAYNVLWAGRLEPQKDVGLALETIRSLVKLRPAHLTILGDGSLRAETERRIASMVLKDHVTCLGHVPNIDPYLASADALLMTSHFEGGPAVIGEALAHGLPLVSTDCCYMLRDVMTIPQAGRIVTSRAASDLAAALFDLGRQPRAPREVLAALVAHLEPEHCARAYLDWFDALAAGRPPACPPSA